FLGDQRGTCGSSTGEEFGITREAQDKWAHRSHERALRAMEEGKCKEQVVPVGVHVQNGDRVLVDTDEAPRKDTSLEKLAKLKPAFDADGTITAGNAPGVNDGAAAFVLMSEEKAAELGKTPMAKIVGHAEVAVEAKDFPKTP